MAQIASVATAKLQSVLAGPSGMPSSVSVIGDLEGVQLPSFSAAQIVAQNVAPEILDHAKGTKYPGLYVYCTKVSNLQREKFRTFSGEAQLAIEVRASQDRLDGLESNLQMYVDAATRVLDENLGDWGNGFFYTGGYEVSFGAVKNGGRNFLQTAKIALAAQVSI